MAWTGFGGANDDYTVPGTPQTTCNGWSSSSESDTGVGSIIGFTLKSFERVPLWLIPLCAQPGPLYCLQQ